MSKILFACVPILLLTLSSSVVAVQQVYKGFCDASAGVAIGPQHFLAVADEYTDEGEDVGDKLVLFSHASSDGIRRQEFPLPALLRTNPNREIDTEGAASIGNRAYWITSHGRNKKGKLRPNRYRVFATDISGSAEALQVNFAGHYTNLVSDLIDNNNWAEPDNGVTRRVVTIIANATRLEEDLDADARKKLAPKEHGLNIEGLAATPDGSGLLIGLRNPTLDQKAIVIRLQNPQRLIAGEEIKGRFDGPFALDLEGLGIRSLEYLRRAGSFRIIAGPKGNGQPFKLFKWAGPPSNEVAPITSLQGDVGSGPEVLLEHPDGDRVLVLNDEGKRKVTGKDCNKVARAQQSFSGRWYEID